MCMRVPMVLSNNTLLKLNNVEALATGFEMSALEEDNDDDDA